MRLPERYQRRLGLPQQRAFSADPLPRRWQEQSRHARAAVSDQWAGAGRQGCCWSAGIATKSAQSSSAGASCTARPLQLAAGTAFARSCSGRGRELPGSGGHEAASTLCSQRTHRARRSWHISSGRRSSSADSSISCSLGPGRVSCAQAVAPRHEWRRPPPCKAGRVCLGWRQQPHGAACGDAGRPHQRQHRGASWTLFSSDR